MRLARDGMDVDLEFVLFVRYFEEHDTLLRY